MDPEISISLSYEAIAVMLFASMALLMLTGQRVFGAIGFVGAVAAVLIWGPGGQEMAFNATIIVMKWYPIVTLPLFVYMGYILSESGIAGDLYKMFHVWLGGLGGGLALGTVVLMVAISAMNGLSVAGMAVGATIAMPEMLKRGYDKRMVSGVIQAGSSLGIMMPPSVVLILYGMIARQPINKLWLAGIGPALMFAAMLAAYILIRCRLQPSLGPPLPKEERDLPRAEKYRLLLSGLIPLFIIFSVTGCFILGLTSLVESSAAGALVATVAAAAKRRLTRKVMKVALIQTLSISCMFLWILMAALCFSSVFDGLGAVHAVENLFLREWGLGPWGVLILMQVSFLIMGMILDDTAMLVIVAPLYIPLVRALGFDLVWYGVLYTVTCQVAYMTPPFGYNLFLMRALAPKSVTLADIYSSIVPFVIIMLIGLILILAFPSIAMWIPEHFSGR
ncbi:MAG: TRAP transporter large permease subunit [Deltaproteobacteria bacterium]|jgi:tripartite ATP-independent transporter DctM subunit|nr:TRAP transporter large permease subunit [Deltaproteobacteria bacterium]